MFKAKSAGSFASKIAHTSTLPSLGNKDLKLLQDLITNEKTVLTTLQKLSVDLTRSSESLKSWGLGEGEDLGDVLSHATNIYAHISTALNNFANHQHTVRAHLKSIRSREEKLDETKRKRKSVAAKADAADKKLSKMSGENKNLPAQTEILTKLRDEIRQLDTEILVEEARLSDFKRLSTRNFMALKLGGLLEFGEKATIIGELGKLLIEEIPLDPTPPGQPRAFYQSHPKTENLDAEVSRCVGEVVFTPPPEAGEHTYAPPQTDSFRPPDEPQPPPADVGPGAYSIPQAQSFSELGNTAPVPQDAGEFGESGHRRFASGPVRMGDDGQRVGGGGQFSTFPVKTRPGAGGGGPGEQSFSATVADALGDSELGANPGAGAAERNDGWPGTPTVNVGGSPWNGDEYSNPGRHARNESQDSSQLPYHSPGQQHAESLGAEKGVRFRTPSMEVSGMKPVAPGFASPMYPSSGSGWGGRAGSYDAPVSPVRPGPDAEEDPSTSYEPTTFDDDNDEQARNAAAAREVAREMDALQFAPPGPPPQYQSHSPTQSVGNIPPTRPLSINRSPSPLAPPSAPFAQPRSVSPNPPVGGGTNSPRSGSPVTPFAPRSVSALSPGPSSDNATPYGTPPEYPAASSTTSLTAAGGPRTISAAAFKRAGRSGSDADLGKKRPLPSSPYPVRSASSGLSQDSLGRSASAGAPSLPVGAQAPDYFPEQREPGSPVMSDYGALGNVRVANGEGENSSGYGQSSDQRQHGYRGPSRAVRHLRACTVGGGTFATCSDGSRCVVAGKDVLRILRVSDPSHEPAHVQVGADLGGRTSVGPGGATIEASSNMWSASGLKMDSAPTDVVWARGGYDTKIVTSARNGEIIYWDINKPGSKCETRIKEHARAVTKLAISPFLPYLLASGSQDGYLRIWDLRTPPTSRMKIYHATAIRALALSPVPSNPLTVCTGLQSGNIQRWDIRNKASPLERIALAHSSPILSMDWQLPSMREAGLGWLVTSGMDRRVKVWDLCLSAGTVIPANSADRDALILSKKMGPRPFRVLHTPFPVRNVCWRPGYDCEVAVVSNNESESETVEVWDIRRGWIGKWALEGAEGGITDIAFAGSHALRAQHANGTFAQHDLRQSFRPLDAIPRVAISWTASGTLAFVTNKQPAVEVPYDDVDPQKTGLLQELRLRRKTTSDPMFQPLQQSLGIQDVPLVDHVAFARLAKAYTFDGDRMCICKKNAEVASAIGQYRAAQTWQLLLSQLTDLREPSPPPSVLSPQQPSSRKDVPHSRTSSAGASMHQIDALPTMKQVDTRPVETSPSGLSRTRTRARAEPWNSQDTPPSSSSSSPRAQTIALSTGDLPSHPWSDASLFSPHTLSQSSPRSFAGSRRASTVLPSTPRPPRPSLRRASMSTPTTSPISEASSNSNPGHKQHKHPHVGEGALDDSDSSSGSDSGSGSSKGTESVSPSAHPARSGKALPSPSPLSKLLVSREDSPDGHLASDERSMSEYDSDVSHSPPSTSSPSDGGSPHDALTAAASWKSRGSSLSLSHRALSKQESRSSIRTVTAAASNSNSPSVMLAPSKLPSEAEEEPKTIVQSSEGLSTRRPSPLRQRPGLGLGLGLTNMGDAASVKENGHGQVGRLSEKQKLEIQEDESRLRDIGWRALREALVWFSEKGDVQMCALLAIVAPLELGVGPLRAARYVEAYIDMLSRLQLHTVAAYVRKYVPYDSVRDTTQVQTTMYTSCGKCLKPVKPSTAGRPVLCEQCKSRPTLCSICHVIVRTLLVHCPTCGHGGHEECYRQFYLTRPLSELPARATTGVASFGSITDSYSSADSTSTVYYSLSEASDRERAEDGTEDDGSEEDGNVMQERERDEVQEYGAGKRAVRRAKMRVLGHACAAGCGHFCWAATSDIGRSRS